jgi:hypothetical protein
MLHSQNLMRAFALHKNTIFSTTKALIPFLAFMLTNVIVHSIQTANLKNKWMITLHSFFNQMQYLVSGCIF